MSINKNRKNISLKEYTEKYTKILNNSSIDELKAILTSMANEVESNSRQVFLDKISSRNTQDELIPNKSGFLDKIEAIEKEILNKTNEEPDWEYYDEDDCLAGYEEFISPLSEMFDKVEALFDYGNYEIARKAYGKLFSIFDIEDDYGRGIRVYNLENADLDEARARYLRSVYLTEKPDKRVSVLLDIMENLANLDFNNRPKLHDIINISTNPLPEFSLFLKKWLDVTKKISKPQYDVWHREATLLLHGVSGMETLAKNEGKKRPRVYIDWIQGLINEKNYKAALDAINTAFKHLPQNKPIRAAIANLMIHCGDELNDKKIQFDGLWFSFEAKPSLVKLIDLYDQCESYNLSSRILKTTEIIQSHMDKSDTYDYERSWENDDIEHPARPSASLLLHAYLLSDENNKAFNLAQKGETLGWSTNTNPQPFFVAYSLVQLTQKPLNKLPSMLKKFWEYALNNSQDPTWDDEGNNNALQKLETIYQNIFLVPRTINKDILDWCLATVENRVSGIVSNQYRNAYERAALLTAACTEALASFSSSEAINFFNKIKNKFPRHPAFQAELKLVRQN